MRPVPLAIQQGDDYTGIANVTSGGVPVDLSGYTAPAAQLRRDVADNDPTVDATFTCTITGPGAITLFLPKATTVTLSGCYVYDLQVVDPTGHLVTIVPRSSVHVIQEVTRP